MQGDFHHAHVIARLSEKGRQRLLDVFEQSVRLTIDGKYLLDQLLLFEGERLAIAAFTPPAPILAPGFGTQGAQPNQLKGRFGSMASFGRRFISTLR